MVAISGGSQSCFGVFKQLMDDTRNNTDKAK